MNIDKISFSDKRSLNCQKASVYSSSRVSYHLEFSESPLYENFAKGLFVNRRYYSAVQGYLSEQATESVIDDVSEMSDDDTSGKSNCSITCTEPRLVL